LVITAPDKDCGKSTLVVDIGTRLLPRPAPMGGKVTEATLFRLTDAKKCTVILDNADELFQKDKNVNDLFVIAWTRGVPITRNTRIGREWVPVDYDVFVPKIVSLINNKKIPSALQSRCLIINLLRALPDQELVEVDPFNDELMEQFKTLKRKLTRWANDNITALKTTAAPIYPANLRTRQKNNAKLLLSIAELAGPEWAETARPALDRILREEREPSWRERLLQELWTVFFEEKLGKAIESGELIKRLITDPTSEWCNYQGKSRHPNQWDIGALLTPIGIRSRQVGKRRMGGYHLKDFLENQIFERWLSRRPLNLSPEKKSKRVSRPRHKKPNRSCKTRG
jgi:hypothetical protein